MSHDLQNDRVETPDDDDEALREYGRQLALDSLLDLALGSGVEKTESVAQVPQAPFASRRLWLRVTVAAVIAMFCWLLQPGKPPVKPGKRGPEHQIEIAQDPAKLVITQVANWQIESNAPNSFQITGPRSIQLERGELRISSADAADGDPLLIETPAGLVTAGQTDLFVGVHETRSPKLEGPPMLNHLTRVLVLAGIASLANSQGTISGGPGHLLAAERDKAPADHVVEANSGFALDLYGQLAREKPGKNLFFSPYSVSTALAMTAEGARGETAAQMARVLRFPEAARRVGNDVQAIPFNVALMHTGFASLNERLNRTDDPATRKVRQQIDSLRKELAEANRQAAALRKDGKVEESNRFAIQSQELAGRLNAVLAEVDQFELQVANAVWVEKTYPVSRQYIDTIARFYKTGGVFPVDFRNDFEGSRRRINSWVDAQTAHQIGELLPAGLFPPDELDRVRMVLTNAIYFKGEWSQVFPADQTREDDFLLSSGNKIAVPMMHHGNLGSAGYAAFNGDGTLFKTPTEVPRDPQAKQPPVYPEESGFAVLDMPYKGGDLSLAIIVPRAADGLEGLEKLLTPENLTTWLKALQVRTVNTFVPRFKLETSYEMSNSLKSLGMARAFVDPTLPEGAQFDGLCESRDPMEQLYIGKVLHQARVEVTEKGTDAAAATAVIFAPPPNMIPETVPFTPIFRADRPFAFVIRDRKSGSVLFMGRVIDPSR